MKRVLEMNVGDCCITMLMYLISSKNGYDSKFYVMLILPQFKIFLKIINLKVPLLKTSLKIARLVKFLPDLKYIYVNMKKK